MRKETVRRIVQTAVLATYIGFRGMAEYDEWQERKKPLSLEQLLENPQHYLDFPVRVEGYLQGDGSFSQYNIQTNQGPRTLVVSENTLRIAPEDPRGISVQKPAYVF